MSSRNRISLTTWLDFDDQQDVEVIINVRVDGDDWELEEVNCAEDGSSLVLTSDLNTAVTNYVNDHLNEAIVEAAFDEADYRYELARDEKMMEKWNG